MLLISLKIKAVDQSMHLPNSVQCAEVEAELMNTRAIVEQLVSQIEEMRSQAKLEREMVLTLFDPSAVLQLLSFSLSHFHDYHICSLMFHLRIPLKI